MIRQFEEKDLSDVMNIWLNTNIQAHSFIDKEYWKTNFDAVKNILPSTEVYVYEEDGCIMAFMGVDNGHIAGIFVCQKMQSKGVGKMLLDKAKEIHPKLSLTVYQKNIKAVDFYQREKFVIQQEQIDEKTKESEYLMTWQKKSSIF